MYQFREIKWGFLLAGPVTDYALILGIASPELEFETLGLEVGPEAIILLGRGSSGRRRGSHDGGYVKGVRGRVVRSSLTGRSRWTGWEIC